MQAKSLLAVIRDRLQRLEDGQQRLSTDTELTESLLTSAGDLLLRLRQLYDQAQGHGIVSEE